MSHPMSHPQWWLGMAKTLMQPNEILEDMKMERRRAISFTYVFPNGKTDTLCLSKSTTAYKIGDATALFGQSHKVVYATVPHENHQIVLLDTGKFELQHDMRGIEYHATIEPLSPRQVLEAIKELQEWVYAQENK